MPILMSRRDFGFRESPKTVKIYHAGYKSDENKGFREVDFRLSSGHEDESKQIKTTSNRRQQQDRSWDSGERYAGSAGRGGCGIDSGGSVSNDIAAGRG